MYRVIARSHLTNMPVAVQAALLRSLSLVAWLVPVVGSAQTDYYNLDRGRPLQTQDALVVERGAFEWQMAPFRWSFSPGVRPSVALEPEVAWGIFPRTQVELGVPIERVAGRWGRGGVHVAVLHALNVETMSWPGVALEAEAVTPGGAFGPRDTFVSIGGVATRTTSTGRIHINAATSVAGGEHESKWRVSVAGDRAFVLRSALLGAEVAVSRETIGRVISLGSGVRLQVDQRSAVDAGIGRRFSSGVAGDAWYFTLGSATSFGIPFWRNSR